jgi:hypothetical protein
MIPEFNDDGYLPPGIHQATMEEIAARFGQESEIRRVQMESLRWLVDQARRAGVQRVIVNGSFVTDRMEPNDVDCALMIGKNSLRDPAVEAELLAGLPFIEMHLLESGLFERFVEKIYATDRALCPKGMIEIVL